MALFVEYLPGHDGLVHVSEMASEYVGDPNEIVKIGAEVHVRVIEIKDDGKVSLTMMSEDEREKAKSNRSDRSEFRGQRKNNYGGGNDRRSRSSGRDDRR